MAEVKWTEVESSNIVRVGVEDGDKPGKVELYVEFKSGTVYVYHNVPWDVTVALRDADSKGKYLNEHIKDKFEYEKEG